MEFMYSKAGKKLLVIEKFKFGFHKNLSEGTTLGGSVRNVGVLLS